MMATISAAMPMPLPPPLLVFCTTRVTGAADDGFVFGDQLDYVHPQIWEALAERRAPAAICGA
jgi:hypothetical protein